MFNFDVLVVKLTDKQNCESLDLIERSLFLVCLDGPPCAIEKSAPNRMTAAALKMVHGGGAKSNSANRWFDKTIQVCFAVILFIIFVTNISRKFC